MDMSIRGPTTGITAYTRCIVDNRASSGNDCISRHTPAVQTIRNKDEADVVMWLFFVFGFRFSMCKCAKLYCIHVYINEIKLLRKLLGYA